MEKIKNLEKKISPLAIFISRTVITYISRTVITCTTGLFNWKLSHNWKLFLVANEEKSRRHFEYCWSCCWSHKNVIVCIRKTIVTAFQICNFFYFIIIFRWDTSFWSCVVSTTGALTTWIMLINAWTCDLT